MKSHSTQFPSSHEGSSLHQRVEAALASLLRWQWFDSHLCKAAIRAALPTASNP